MNEEIYEAELYFIGKLLEQVENNAPIGFSKATMEFDKLKIEWTTIIVNDDPTMEVLIYNKQKDLIYWRVTLADEAVLIYRRWAKQYL